MLTKQDGNLQKRHYTHVYMRCNHVHLQPCTYILDVNKRGVLGSADDDIAFFFAYFVIFYSSWVDPLVFIGFSLL